MIARQTFYQILFLVALAGWTIGLPGKTFAQNTDAAISAGTQSLLDARFGMGIWALDALPDPDQTEFTDNDFKPTYVRDTLEAVRALQITGVTETEFGLTIDWLETFSGYTTGQFAQRTLLLTQAARDVSEALSNLQSRQNVDGGFGVANGFPSDPLETAQALEALAAVDRPLSNEITAAINYLISQQNADGGWSVGPNGSSVYLTAIALHSLIQHRNAGSAVPAAITAAQNFLVSQRGGDLWDDLPDTAIALIALLQSSTAFTQLEASVQALENSQNANGSWEDDTYHGTSLTYVTCNVTLVK